MVFQNSENIENENDTMRINKLNNEYYLEDNPHKEMNHFDQITYDYGR